MAYHIYIEYNNKCLPEFEWYLGSAVSIDLYWEGVGRKLGLPLISSITEKADYDGFSVDSDDLVRFRDELLVLENFWHNDNDNSFISVPENFLDGLREIILAVEKAIDDGSSVVIG